MKSGRKRPTPHDRGELRFVGGGGFNAARGAGAVPRFRRVVMHPPAAPLHTHKSGCVTPDP